MTMEKIVPRAAVSYDQQKKILVTQFLATEDML